MQVTYSARAGVRQWLALVALIMPVLTVTIATTGLAFAVPALSVDLRPTGRQLLWIMDVYPLALAGLLVPMGVLGDDIGRRKLLLIGTVLFTGASVVAAYAPTAEWLIAARALMGVTGAGLLPSTMSLIQTIFGHPTDRRLAIAVWSAGFAAGNALGPIVGGWVIDRFWWGAIFLIPLVMNAIFLAAAPFLVPESRNPHPGKLDALSIALSIGTITPLAFGVKQAATTGLNLASVLPLAVTALCGWWFVRRQLALTYPLVDVGLFRNRVISTAVIANFSLIFVFAGAQFFLAQHLQLVTGLPPREAGWWMLPGALTSLVAGVAVVRLCRLVPRWAVVGVGLTITSLGAAAGLFLRADTSLVVPVAMYVVLALGNAMSQTINTDALLAAAPPERAGAASGISETAFELGTALGIAVLGGILTVTYARGFTLPAEVVSQVTPEDAEAADQTLGAAAGLASALPEPLGASVLGAAQHAFVHAEQVASLVAAVGLILVAMAVARSYRRAGLGTTA